MKKQIWLQSLFVANFKSRFIWRRPYFWRNLLGPVTTINKELKKKITEINPILAIVSMVLITVAKKNDFFYNIFYLILKLGFLFNFYSINDSDVSFCPSTSLGLHFSVLSINYKKILIRFYFISDCIYFHH